TAICLTTCPAAIAQTQPAGPIVATADLAAPEKDLGDERKYWVLHKPGISFETAQRDLQFCWRYVPHGIQRSVPGFVPWRQNDANRPVTYDGGNYGLVGMVIASMIAGPLERSIRQSRMFRCMVPRGYHRYRITEDRWKQIYQAPSDQAIATLAAIASGPVPPNPQVLP
ncbi:MAG: hypothetical protein ACKOPG_13265, partial [Novosphingobium sp.]